MKILALDGKREELLTLVERFKENVKEKKVLLPLLIALNCVLVESKSLTADGTSFIRLHKEYMEMKIETIMMKIKTNKTDVKTVPLLIFSFIYLNTSDFIYLLASMCSSVPG